MKQLSFFFYVSMYLKRLEIQGFKSFAKKTTLEFEPGITAIVGPNGSGKSNVADCLRWVLGEQSSKLLRGKKSDDVIFAGSDKKVRLGFAEVAVTFDNSDRRIPLDAAEVSIGRRIDRSGESSYLINNQTVRLLDIVDLVLKSNIGTSRYTVIGQGTIDQLILAGPAEIKNLFDEASGVKTYYIKREKTLRRLEQTAQNLMRVEDVLAEIEPRLKSLRRQAKRMEAREVVEAELRVLQREWYSHQYHAIHQSILRLDGELASLATERSYTESELRKHTDEIRSIEQQDETTRRENTSQYEHLRGLASQKQQLLEQQSIIRGKLEAGRGGIGNAAALSLDSSKIKAEMTEYEDKLSRAQATVEHFGAEAKRLGEKLSGLAGQVARAKDKEQSGSSVNWATLAEHITTFEQKFSRFYQGVLGLSDASEIKELVRAFQEEFRSFHRVVGQAAVAVKLSGGQQELSKLLQEQEGLLGQLRDTEGKLTQGKLTIEFTENALHRLRPQALNAELEQKKSASASPEDFAQSLLAEDAGLSTQLESIGTEITLLELKLAEAEGQAQQRQGRLRHVAQQVQQTQQQLNQLRDKASALQVERARFETQEQGLTTEAVSLLGPDVFAEVKNQTASVVLAPDTESKIQKLKNQMDVIGGVDELTLQEYQETETRYTHLSEQVQDLKRGMEDLKQVIEELDGHIKSKFNESFHRINEKFENYFRLLFNGGRATLSILRATPSETNMDVDSDERSDSAEATSDLRPEEKILQKYEQSSLQITGIDIKATPPGKKLSSIQALSGGERALTAIAMLCSMLACFPSPFVVLDEVDAALDEANTIRFGQILGSLSHQTQFITITHNRETMAQSGALYGVSMGDDGVSQLLSIKFDQARAYAK